MKLHRVEAVALCCLLFAGAAVAQDLKTLEREFARMRAAHEMRFSSSNLPEDVRGRHQSDDFEQYVYTDELRERMKALLKRAHGKDSTDSKDALAEAAQLMRVAQERQRAISRYWDRTQAIYWRTRWKLFAKANRLPADPPDPALTDDEKILLEQLAAGDFIRAADDGAPRLGKRVHEIMLAAEARVVKERNSSDLQFIRNDAACKAEPLRGPDSEVRILGSPGPRELYPPASKRREEEGNVVVRARVPPTGCVSEVAIVVRSGYPDLDAAALEIARASRYAPASSKGQAIDGEVTFRVKWTLKGDND